MNIERVVENVAEIDVELQVKLEIAALTLMLLDMINLCDDYAVINDPVSKYTTISRKNKCALESFSYNWFIDAAIAKRQYK